MPPQFPSEPNDLDFMFRVDTIDSFDLPELQPYRTMRRQTEHREQGNFRG